LLLALSVASCTTVGTSDGRGGSVLPEGAHASWFVTIGLGDTRAHLYAAFSKDLTTEFRLTQGETIAVNGILLEENNLLGVAYDGYSPLLDVGSFYSFVLTVPNKGDFTRSLPMLPAAMFTSPIDGSTFATSGFVAINWTEGDANATEVDVTMQKNGDGQDARMTLQALPGGTNVALSSVQLRSLYHAAAGSVGGSVVGSLTLKRTHSQDMKPPFAAGTAEIERTLDRVMIKLTPN
jgi:hypothetical protein